MLQLFSAVPTPWWGSLFQILTLATVGLMFSQIAIAERVDKLRRNQVRDFAFRLRKGSMIGKLVMLCLCVAYGYDRGWDPWPPIVLFLVAADINIISEILVLRKDEKRLEQLNAVTGSMRTTGRRN